jgi:hypothetical protein
MPKSLPIALQDEFSEVCAQLFADLTEHLRAFAETTRQFADLRQKLAMLLSQALYSGEVAVRTPSDLSKIVDAYAKLADCETRLANAFTMLLRSLSEQQALIISIRTNQALPSRPAPAFSMPLTPILPEEEGE